MKRGRNTYVGTAAVALSLAIAAVWSAQINEPRSPSPPITLRAGVAPLHHDPQFILEAVARRMGVTLRPEVPPPTIRLESRTPLYRLQRAAERQWGFRPLVFVTTYASASNEIYLIDRSADYLPYGRTPDDALAHELVHYIQANYLKDDFSTDWSEVEAVAVQTWFRETFIDRPVRVTSAARPAPGVD
jgi:hypothetical protein